MARQLVGDLLQPGGAPLVGELRFVALDDNASGLVDGAGVVITVDDGSYDIALEDGRYRVDFSYGKSFFPIGNLVINGGAAATLPELLI